MTDRKYSCQGCTRSDLTLTANGRVRSHAANGKRASADNPACGMGSQWPLENTEFHTHTYVITDEGSVCECGLVEAEPDLSDDPSLHVPPNPFRDPLPGGVWGNGSRDLPMSLGMGSGPVDLAEQSTRSRGPVGADDFLDDSDDDLGDTEEADDGRRYFPSRYDGTCITCLAHFDEGDMITRGPDDDGWEAQQCCGEGAVKRPERPKAVARTLPVVRGRYKLPDPETGKPLSASRASKFAEGIADSYALDQWRHRMILVGLVQDPEILDKVASCLRDKQPLDVVKQEREFLNARADEAMTAAGGDIRSGQGTKLHKYTEELDGGTRTLADVPEDYRPDAEAYVTALAACGFRPVLGLIERSVFCRELKVCGTFDRVLECIHDTEVVDLYGRPVQIHAGEFVIGDVKSGDNIKHPWLEIQIQEAIYAHAVNENGVAVQDTPGGPFRWAGLAEMGAAQVREDVGIVMHVPFGQGAAKLYFTDLIIGWRGAKICQQNKEFWKIELPHVPVAEFVVGEAPSVGPDPDLPDCPHPLTHRAGCGCPDDDSVDPSTLAKQDEAMASMVTAAEDMGVIQPDTSPAVPDAVVVHPFTFEDHVRCACGARWHNIEIANAYGHDFKECDEPEPPAKNIMEAVHRAKHAAQPEPAPKGTDWWERAFRSVSTRGAANTVWREAKDAGLPETEIKRLVGLVQLGDQGQTAVSRPPEPSPAPVVAPEPETPPAPAQDRDGPTLTERAHAVTGKAEASKIFREMTDKIGELPEGKREAARAYRDKLVKIMQDRLALA